jgi:integrase
LRIGEVVALKWNDIDYESKAIHIHRMETLEENVSGSLSPVIAEYTKKKSPYGDRILPLGDYELTIFQYVMDVNKEYGYSDQDFIFCDAQGRTKIREIDNRIRKLCNKADIKIKSAHDIRRTVASELFNNGVPVEIIRNYLGHSDIKTTWGYILDNHRKEETARMIVNSLVSLNGLKRTQTV